MDLRAFYAALAFSIVKQNVISPVTVDASDFSVKVPAPAFTFALIRWPSNLGAESCVVAVPRI